MFRAPRSRRLAATALAGLLVMAVALPATARPPAGGRGEQRATTTQVQLLSLNDFHGNLEPPG